VLAAVLVVPDVLRLDRISPFSQLVAFRPVLASAAAVVAVVLGLLAISFRPLWPFAAVLGVVVAIAAVLVVPRTIRTSAPAQGRQYTVLAFNAYVGRADVYALAELIQTERPDLVALPETGARFRARLAPLVRPLGYRILTADDGSGREVRGMTALAAGALGDVQTCAPNGTSYPHVEVRGGALRDLRFVGVHLAPPRAPTVARWRSDLAALARWCSGDSPVIIAGDLNATLDHSALREAMRGCSDAAAQRGAGLIGTWPSNRPRWLGPQIDHVLVTDGISAQSFDVIDIPGSDHRAILTRLVVPDRLGDQASRPG
jgi:endonuclease/exonuclease/phosphatase (EEP) superfamily protein YafD